MKKVLSWIFKQNKKLKEIEKSSHLGFYFKTEKKLINEILSEVLLNYTKKFKYKLGSHLMVNTQKIDYKEGWLKGIFPKDCELYPKVKIKERKLETLLLEDKIESLINEFLEKLSKNSKLKPYYTEESLFYTVKQLVINYLKTQVKDLDITESNKCYGHLKLEHKVIRYIKKEERNIRQQAFTSIRNLEKFENKKNKIMNKQVFELYLHNIYELEYLREKRFKINQYKELPEMFLTYPDSSNKDKRKKYILNKL